MTTHIKTLIALVGMLVGVAISEKTKYVSEVAIGSLLIGCLQMGIYFFNKRTTWKNEVEEKINNNVPRFSISQACGIFFIVVAVFILRVQFSSERSNFVCEATCTFTATIVSSPTIKNEYQIFSVHPDTEADIYDVQVKTPLYPKFEVGERVTLSGKVTLPYRALPHNGDASFDYETYLRVQGVGSEMLYPKVTVLPSGQYEYSFVAKLQRMREHFTQNIFLYVRDPSASLATGMLFGVTRMSQELTQTFRTSGISHIIVLSGFNVAILISFVLSILIFIPIFIRIFAAGVFVIFFVLMVGGEASIVRATIMSFIGLTALLIGRAYVARQALLLSLIAIVFYEPIHLLHDVSLHLSFLATAGIVYMSDGVKSLLSKIKSKAYQEIIATTFSAYVVTLPYVMYTFGTMSMYALLTNFIALPLVPVMMLVTFLVTVVAEFSGYLSLAFGFVDTILGGVIIFVAESVERLPYSLVPVSISFGLMCFMYSVLLITYEYFVYKYIVGKKDETAPTKNDEIWSGVISY